MEPAQVDLVSVVSVRIIFLIPLKIGWKWTKIPVPKTEIPITYSKKDLKWSKLSKI